MSQDPNRVYNQWFDPITSPLDIPSEGIDGDCDRVFVSFPREWSPVFEAVLRRLEFYDAWNGTDEQAQWAVDQIGIFIERLYEGELTYA